MYRTAYIYLVSNILNAVVPFLLLPILTRYLSPAEYGQIAMFQTLLAGISTFIGLNSVGAANRKFYDGEVNEKVLKEYNGSCIQILLVSSVITFITIFIFKDKLSEFLAIPVLWIYASVLISILSFITSMRLGQWQIRSQAKWFGVLQVSSSVINMLLSLFFVIIITQGAKGRIDALVISGGIVAIISGILLYKDRLLKILIWKPKYLKEALSFGVPLIPHHIGFFLINSFDRFFINEKLGLTDAGVYMVAVQLSYAVAIIFDAINKAYVPWLFERLKRNDYEEKKNIVKYTYIYYLILLFIAVVLFLIGPFFVILIAGDKYVEAGRVIGLLCLGQVFGGMYLMVTNYVFFAKKTTQLSIVTITTGIVNIILLLILVGSFGMVGAAFSFAISRFIQFIMCFNLARIYIKMPWNLSLGR